MMKFRIVDGECNRKIAVDEDLPGVLVKHHLEHRHDVVVVQTLSVDIPLHGTYDVEITVKRSRAELPAGYLWVGDSIGTTSAVMWNVVDHGVVISHRASSVPLWVIEAFQKEGLL
jgi:hypothetical protein